jgi:hypothetical protein
MSIGDIMFVLFRRLDLSQPLGKTRRGEQIRRMFSLRLQALAVVPMKDIIFKDVEFCRLAELD